MDVLGQPLALDDETPLLAAVPDMTPAGLQATPVALLRIAARGSHVFKVVLTRAETDDSGDIGAPTVHPALRAVEDLRQWLRLNRAEALSLAGLQESAYYWWRDHPRAEIKPGKAGRIL